MMLAVAGTDSASTAGQASESCVDRQTVLSVSRPHQRRHSRSRHRSCYTRRRRIAWMTGKTRPSWHPDQRIRRPIPQRCLHHTQGSVPLHQRRECDATSAFARLKPVLKPSSSQFATERRSRTMSSSARFAVCVKRGAFSLELRNRLGVRQRTNC